MTGWRIGWGIAPAELVQAMTAIQSQVSSGANSIGQAATAAALQANDRTLADFIEHARNAYARRAALTVAAIHRISGLRLLPPDGAFFAYIHCGGLIGQLRPDGRVLATDGDVVDWLLDSAGVAVVEGAAYGLSPYFRLSFAVADHVLEAALQRIEQAVGTLGPALAEAHP